MPRFVVVCLALALAIAAACSGHNPGGGGSADAPAADAKVFMDAMGSNLPRCMGSAYDTCNPAASNCVSGTTCHTFMAAGISVCSPTCSSTMPCPMQGTTSISCNMMGLCKPPMANACTP
jgi:hypothetical protein